MVFKLKFGDHLFVLMPKINKILKIYPQIVKKVLKFIVFCSILNMQ